MDAGREVEACVTRRAGPAGAGGSSTQHVTSHVPGPLRGLQRETKLELGRRGTPCRLHTPQYLHTLLGGGPVWQQCSSRGPLLHILPIARGHQHLQPWQRWAWGNGVSAGGPPL